MGVTVQESFGSSEIHSRSRGSSNLVLGKLRLPEEQYLAGKKAWGISSLAHPCRCQMWCGWLYSQNPHPTPQTLGRGDRFMAATPQGREGKCLGGEWYTWLWACSPLCLSGTNVKLFAEER